MHSSTAQPIALRVTDSIEVSGLWQHPPGCKACFVLAHGAGAGMQHPLLEAVASGLASRRIGTLRFQFPYMDRGSRRPDPPRLCHAAVRAAVTEAARRTDVPLIAGGRSFGGRMSSQAQAENPLPGVRGLAFLGFPLHPAKKPATERADHLAKIDVPLLFLQGTRDELADLQMLEGLIARLGPPATLKLFDQANHSFHVPARSGRSDKDILEELLDSFTDWTVSVVG